MLIREKFENCNFSGSETDIVNYILENKLKIRDMTTKEIAGAVYASPSTLIRIAHKMGYKGWSDLKQAYIEEEEYLQSHFRDIDANYPFSRDDNIMSIASKLSILKKEAIEDTCSLVNHDDLQKAVQLIRKHNSISIFAVSNNIYISEMFVYNMSHIQKRVNICKIQGEMVYTAANTENDACAIIVSYSGETPILIRAVNALKANHIPIIAITSIGENSLSALSDVTLRISTREKLYSKIANYTTNISFEYILDLLFSCVFALDYNKNLNRKIEISKMIETGRFSTVDIIKEDEY